MADGIFAKEAVNTGRQKEIDLFKAFSIIMMIITHCIDDLFNYEGHLIAEIIDDQLAQIIGAQGFMICMGLGIAYSKKAAAKEHLSRGFMLLIIGQLLNLLRYALPGVLIYAVTGDAESRAYVFLTFSSDIMQFAGLFMICMALFTRLSMSSGTIFAVSVICNIVGTLTYGRISTGSYAADQFIGMFFFTETESYFPLVHWMIFPAFGLLFGEILRRVKDKRRFYLITIVPSAIVFVLYYIVELCVDQSVFTLFTEWRSFCYIRTVDAIPALFANVAVISLFYFLSVPLGDSQTAGLNFVSKNINRYYCTHYLFVMPLSMYLTYVNGDLFNNGIYVIITAVTVLVLTTAVVYVYDRYLVKRFRGFFGKNKAVWISLVLALSVIASVWAYNADADYFPNLVNDYGWERD